MNINQDYGNIEMPSEIYDSFEQSKLNEHLQQSHYTNSQKNMNDSFNLDSSMEDTFLQNFDHLNNEKKKVQIKKQEPSISVSSSEIKVNLLPGQKHSYTFQIVNASALPITTKLQSVFKICLGFNQDVKEIELGAWQRAQLKLMIEQPQNQFGDIFETIIGQYWFNEEKTENRSNLSRKKQKVYIKVEVHFISPRLKLKYNGCSDVVNVRGSKVSMNKIAKNKYGEYVLEVCLSGMERFECKIEVHGDMTLIPQGFTLYNDELRKITLRKGERKNGVLILRVLNAKVIFALGIQLI